ncbi:MAG TPA: chorismate synthase [Clostridia bacterium]|nr:chorismate synthase [Clostridia bacterium]
MNTWGNRIKLTVFGTSHGAALGCVLDGIRPGLKLDFDAIDEELIRRMPRADGISTARKEPDRYELLSGVYNSFTDGTPVCAVFKNADARSEEYPHPEIPRPSHADYAAHKKYNGFNDPRGGGMFSGRMTLPLVFAGAVARQYLKERGITVKTHVLMIGGVSDENFDPVHVNAAQLQALDPFFPLLDKSAREKMELALASAREQGDSLGCAAECAAVGLDAGLGEPFFQSLESSISSLLFSVPAIKAVEFGAGLGFAHGKGSELNDGFRAENGAVKTLTNFSGGVNGGMANGMPLIVRAAFRPVPTIKKAQQSVNLKSMNIETLSHAGRHDACILPRGLAAVEAAVCLALLDAYGGF